MPCANREQPTKCSLQVSVAHLTRPHRIDDLLLHHEAHELIHGHAIDEREGEERGEAGHLAALLDLAKGRGRDGLDLPCQRWCLAERLDVLEGAYTAQAAQLAAQERATRELLLLGSTWHGPLPNDPGPTRSWARHIQSRLAMLRPSFRP